MAQHVLSICGSIREGSYNRKLMQAAVAKLNELGATVTEFDFRKTPLPLFDPALEIGPTLPENVMSLKREVAEADAVLIASPEYNASVSPVMKNAIDWVSRENDAMGTKNDWSNKVIAVLTASPGAFGGIRAQSVYRQSFAKLGAFTLPDMVAVPLAAEAFDESGALTNERTKTLLDKCMVRLLEVSLRLKGL